MGGRNTRTKVLRIRYKDGNGIKSRLYLNLKSRKPPAGIPGRILRWGKVSQQELFHTGEFNEMPKMLMREFRRNEKKKGIAEKFEQIERELAAIPKVEAI